MRRLAWVLGSLMAAALLTGSMAADEPPKIYECTDANGDTVYQDDPCVETPPAPPQKAVAAPKAKPKSKKPPAKPPAKPIKFVVPKSGPPVIPSTALPPSNRSIDSRWITPDRTLKTFLAAIEAGDRTAAVSCLTSSALADWGPEPEALPLEKLRKTVESFTGYVAEGDLGPYWSIRALRAGMRPKWIFFERNGDGEWKIGAL